MMDKFPIAPFKAIDPPSVILKMQHDKNTMLHIPVPVYAK